MVSNYILIIAIILSFGNNSSIDSVAYNQEINTSLSKVFKDSFDIGAAVSNSFTNSSEVKNILKTHFTSITAENEMKPESLLKKNGGYNWRQADAIIDFARKNKIKVRGHTLLWHKQTPSWFFTDAKNRNLTKEGLYLKQFNYMKSVMNHFDYIKVWDVVNEAITDNNNSNQIFRTKNSKWFEICGEEFIEKAFIMAHSIGPDKKLFYNDYNLLNKKKQDRVFQMLKNLIDKGVPIHGVGIQAHWTIYDSISDIENLIMRFSTLNLEIHITELDLSVFKKNDKSLKSEYVFNGSEEEKQAKLYGKIFKIFNKHKDKISNVSFWGISDKESWLNNHPVKGRRNYPLLFNDYFEPKKNFFSITNIN